MVAHSAQAKPVSELGRRIESGGKLSRSTAWAAHMSTAGRLLGFRLSRWQVEEVKAAEPFWPLADEGLKRLRDPADL